MQQNPIILFRNIASKWLMILGLLFFITLVGQALSRINDKQVVIGQAPVTKSLEKTGSVLAKQTENKVSAEPSPPAPNQSSTSPTTTSEPAPARDEQVTPQTKSSETQYQYFTTSSYSYYYSN